MEQLWAPWRLAYVATAKTPIEGDCFLCRGRDGHREPTIPTAQTAQAAQRDPLHEMEQVDRSHLVAWRGDLSLVVLNRFPYNNGHLLIAPRAHKAHLEDLTNDELLDLQVVICRCVRELNALMHPDGYNIGLNLGRSAGAGLPGHLHWHLVPRWNGDTNFMPVLTDTKVIVQSLDTLWELLKDRLKEKE